jgi:branched-subunit amino acid transport protein
MNLWLTIVLGGLLTFATRLSFIILLERITVPIWFQRSLRFVPVAVLSAIIAPGLFSRNGTIDLSLGNAQILAGLLAIVVAWRTKNILLTISAGMAALVILQALLARV